MVCMTLAVLMLLLSYFSPIIGGHCLCQFFFVSSITLYVIGFYSIKFAFALHGHFEYMIAHFREESQALDRFQALLADVNGRFLAGFFFIFGLLSAALINFFNKGMCRSDGNKFGCETSFNRSFGIVVIGTMLVDATLFGYVMLTVFSKIQGENAKLFRRFFRYWILGSILVVASLIDICINVIYPQYPTLVAVLVDCSVMITCNLLAFSPILMESDCCCGGGERLLIDRDTATTGGIRLVIDEVKAKKESLDLKPSEVVQTQPEMHAIPEQNVMSEKLRASPASTPTFKGCRPLDGPKGISLLQLPQQGIQGSITPSPKLRTSPSVPSTPIFRGRETDSSDWMSRLSFPGKESNSGSERTDAITDLTDNLNPNVIAATCPRCHKELLIRDDDDKWERLKMHIIAFHLDDVV